jgi:hypothetical protein
LWRPRYLRSDVSYGPPPDPPDWEELFWESQHSEQRRRRTHVDTDDRADHLGNNDHVTEMRLDHRGLLVGASLLLGLAELLDEAHRAALESALEPPAGTGVDELRRRASGASGAERGNAMRRGGKRIGRRERALRDGTR